MDQIIPQVPESANLIICPFCYSQIIATAVFCPSCGKKVRETPISTGIAAQLLIYFLSLFLPPFGLGSTLRYLRNPDPKAHMIGIISLIMTISAIFIAIYMFTSLVSSLTGSLSTGGAGSTYQDLKDLGF